MLPLPSVILISENSSPTNFSSISIFSDNISWTSSNVLKSIDVIKYSKDNFDSLYDNISEFVFNEDSEYEIILKNGRTKILLGSDNIFAKIDYLNAFANALPETKKLESYRYVDLRYKRQIVVNEI